MNEPIRQFTNQLNTLKPLQLQAVDLLKTLRAQTGELMPLPPDEPTKARMIEATTELVTYTRNCRAMAQRLSLLTPIPLCRLPMEEAHESG